ncbi:MAG: DedA family protein [Patescibacteria group bacterium]
MFDFLFQFFVRVIDSAGYVGVFILMIMESMVLPVPSEAVMPFAGFLIFQNKMIFLWVVLFSTIGSIIGSLLSYAIGYYGGRPLLYKYGKFLFLNQHHLDQTENFFNKFGSKTIFVSRFIPIIRHLISIPAGVARMNLGKFLIYTTVGAGLWNSFLTYLGFLLGQNWSEIKKVSHVLDILMILVIIGAVIWFFSKNKNKK